MEKKKRKTYKSIERIFDYMKKQKELDKFIFKISTITRDNFSDTDVVMDKARNETKKFLQAHEKEVIERIVPKLVKDKPSCTEDNPCGCHFGETNHADGKCICDIKNNLFKS